MHLMKRLPFRWFIIPFFMVSALAACTTRTNLLPASDSQVINNGSSFGQTFTAQNRGLVGISVLLAPSNSPHEGSLMFHLRTSPQATDDIARARLPISEITRQAYYKFDFA